MTEQPLVLYDFRNPEEAFELMRGGKKGIVTEDFVIKLTALIARLQEQLNEANALIKKANQYWYQTRVFDESDTEFDIYLEKWCVK